MGTVPEKIYDVESPKYGIHGVIRAYDFALKLSFSYQDRQVEFALNCPYPCDDSAICTLGAATIDSYIDDLQPESPDKRKLMLHHWYVDEVPYEDGNYLAARGIVSGHKRLMDAEFITTSEIEGIFIDREASEAVIKTYNSVYRCPLEYCQWRKQDEAPEVLPEYEWIKENFQGKIRYPSIEEGNVLLVLSNFDSYYFNSLYYRPVGAAGPVAFTGFPHIGMFQDSFLIGAGKGKIDIRYFPHYQNIDFYTENTAGKPFFLENIGDVVLFAKTSQGLIKLAPGERKQVVRGNAESEEPVLPRGDLYSMGIG